MYTRHFWVRGIIDAALYQDSVLPHGISQRLPRESSLSWREARQAGTEAPAVHCVQLAGNTSTIQARLHMLSGLTTATGFFVARPRAVERGKLAG